MIFSNDEMRITYIHSHEFRSPSFSSTNIVPFSQFITITFFQPSVLLPCAREMYCRLLYDYGRLTERAPRSFARIFLTSFRCVWNAWLALYVQWESRIFRYGCINWFSLSILPSGHFCPTYHITEQLFHELERCFSSTHLHCLKCRKLFPTNRNFII